MDRGTWPVWSFIPNGRHPPSRLDVRKAIGLFWKEGAIFVSWMHKSALCILLLKPALFFGSIPLSFSFSLTFDPFNYSYLRVLGLPSTADAHQHRFKRLDMPLEEFGGWG